MKLVKYEVVFSRSTFSFFVGKFGRLEGWFVQLKSCTYPLTRQGLKSLANSSGLTHSASSATMQWRFQLLKQRSEQGNFVSVRKS